MNDQENTQQPEQDELLNNSKQDPPEETVGDIMQKASGDGIKFWLIITSVVVYIAGIVYAEVHGVTMLQKGVPPDMRIWATLGMVAAGITALTLPLALKFWTIEAKQRIAAFCFYLADFAFLAFNAFTDFNVNAGERLVPWAQTYVTYILPASPIIVAACWSVIWQLDPDVRQKILALTLRAAMKEKLARKVADAAKGAKVTDTVNAAAEREIERALTELFGTPVTAYTMQPSDDTPQIKGLLKSFFAYWLRRAQQAYSFDTASPSNPQPSDPPQEH